MYPHAHDGARALLIIPFLQRRMHPVPVRHYALLVLIELLIVMVSMRRREPNRTLRQTPCTKECHELIQGSVSIDHVMIVVYKSCVRSHQIGRKSREPHMMPTISLEVTAELFQEGFH